MNKPIDSFQGRPIVSQHAGLTVTRVGARSAPRSAASICAGRSPTRCAMPSRMRWPRTS